MSLFTPIKFQKHELERLNISKYRKFLKARQDAIIYESEEDEGAAEYSREIQSIIDTIDCYGTVDCIKEAAANVGEPCLL